MSRADERGPDYDKAFAVRRRTSPATPMFERPEPDIQEPWPPPDEADRPSPERAPALPEPVPEPWPPPDEADRPDPEDPGYRAARFLP